MKDSFKNKIRTLLVGAWSSIFLLSTQIYGFAAGGLNSSQLVRGTQKLIQDLTSWGTGIAAAIGTLCTVYFFIRRQNADEQEVKSWNKRIITAIISTIGAVLAGLIISIVLSYYQ